MIRVEITRDGRGRVTWFKSEGHSGIGPPGADIVCAGVSAITQTAALGLRRIGALRSVTADSGLFSCSVDPDRSGAEAVTEAMILGLTEIAGQYPTGVEIIDPDHTKTRSEKT